MANNGTRGVGGNVPAQQMSQSEINEIRATSGALVFRDNNIDYYPSTFNSMAIQKFISDNQLDPFRSSSYQEAYDTLLLRGELELEPKKNPAPPAQEESYEPLPGKQRLGGGTIVGHHRPDQLEDLYKLPLGELKKMVDQETSGTRASLQRRNVRL
jgi:hypothetical protein